MPTCSHIYDSNNLTQLITKPTRTTNNTKRLIDHAVTNRPSQILDSGVIPCGISDHDIIYVLRNSRLAKIKKEPKVVNIRNFKRFSASDFVRKLEGLPFNLINDLGYTPDEMWHTWKTIFLDVLNKHAPTTSTKIRSNSHPYLTADVKLLMRSRDSLKAKANKTGSKYIKVAYQHMRNKFDYKIRELKVNYYTNKITENKGSIKGTWKVLKQLTGKATKSISIGKLTTDEEETSEKQEVSNKLNQYFSSIGENLSQDIQTSTMSPVKAIKRTYTSFKLKQITPKQVYNLLVSLPNGIANGIDMIPNKLLKISAHVISSSLTDIFNYCTSLNIFPDDLKVAKVVLIFKAGMKDDPGNYRPISILSSVARVSEKRIYDQLYHYFSSNNLLGKQQWSFRKMHSTVLALQSATNK